MDLSVSIIMHTLCFSTCHTLSIHTLASFLPPFCALFCNLHFHTRLGNRSTITKNDTTLTPFHLYTIFSLSLKSSSDRIHSSCDTIPFFLSQSLSQFCIWHLIAHHHASHRLISLFLPFCCCYHSDRRMLFYTSTSYYTFFFSSLPIHLWDEWMD
jgi:hypothetical protein